MPSTRESNGTVTAISASQVIKEYKDRESCKLNVPESESIDSSSRITPDTNIVADIADNGSVDVSTTMDLGEDTCTRKISTFEGLPL